MLTISRAKNLRVLSLLTFVLFWQILALILNTLTFPSPLSVLSSLYIHIFEDDLLYHLYKTFFRVFISFFIVMFFGILFGILMGKYKNIDKSLDSILVIFLNIPAIVLIMLFYIWFGLNDFAAILAVIFNKVPLVIVNIREGCKAVNNDFEELKKVYKISFIEYYKKIYFPQIYSFIMASARSSLSLIWKIVLVVELLGRSDGIGFQLMMFFQFFDIKSILAYSFAFIIIVLYIEKFILQKLESKFTSWR